MAQTSDVKGLPVLAMAGIASVAVVLGGVMLVRMGGFDFALQEPAPATDSAQVPLAISPSKQDPPADRPAEQAATGQEGGQPSAAQRQASDPGGTATQATADSVNEPGPDSPRETAALAPADAPEPAPEAAGASPEAAAADSPEAAPLEAPVLDIVRVDPEGAAVVAGRGQPGTRISVMLNGTVLDDFEVPQDGAFVSLLQIQPKAEAQTLSLVASRGGRQMPSDAAFILAPSAASASRTADAAAETAQEDGAVADARPATAASQAQAQVSDAREEQPPQQPAGDAEPQDTASAVASAAPELGSAAQAPAAPPREMQPQPAPKPEVAAVAVLRADETGVQLVQPGGPAEASLQGKVSLDTISYSGTGEVQLGGRARPAALVRVYLDNSPLAGITAAGDGQWAANLADVTPGVYTLRLDEIDPADGRVLSRLETPFKRESPDALARPAAAGDANGGAAPLVRAVTVQKGDTLWAISRERYGSGFLYVRVFEANKDNIRDPDLIYPGQVFTIPE